MMVVFYELASVGLFISNLLESEHWKMKGTKYTLR